MLRLLLFILLFFSSIANAAVINGIDDEDILNLINSKISNWKDFSKEAISTKFKLNSDRKQIKTILSSYGYFDAEVVVSQKSNEVIFDVKLNERYKFNDIALIYTDQPDYKSGIKVSQAFDLINIEYDSYTNTKQIGDGQDKIINFLKKNGFAFVNISSLKMKINKETKKIRAVYKITLNGKTMIDKTIINLESKKDPDLLKSFIKNRIPWKDGDFYDLKKIIEMKDDLMSSGIFSGIDVKLSDPVWDDKNSKISHTVVTINVTEAPLRDISAGLKYGSSEKVGVLLSWTHYNINGKGSKLSTLLDMTKNLRVARVKYNAYDLFYKKQDLATQIFYTKENVAAYDVSKVGVETILWQTFARKFNLGAGLCCENSKTKDKIDASRIEFNAFGVPLGMNFDTTDNYLDPQKGTRCLAMVTPYFSKKSNMTLFHAKASVYIPVKENSFKSSPVIAIFSKIGAIFRDKNHKIPRDKLFFSGGANSVRGYGYQKIGEVDDKKRPLGGESVFEIGIEPRFKISEDVGLVIFFEGGTVCSSKVPHPFKKMLFGYGIGVRYYTPLAPIRLDLAFPTKRRKTQSGKRIDSMFNLYISIGQAF
ncbi:MAG: BamA/TamA family outer membrane protein [Holosporales bacterium]|nr:BamA/TamA family outer membrane protein [Holosporales bacterium]